MPISLLGFADYLRNDLPAAEIRFEMVHPYRSSLLPTETVRLRAGLDKAVSGQSRRSAAVDGPVQRCGFHSYGAPGAGEPAVEGASGRTVRPAGYDLALARSFLPSLDDPPAGLDLCYEFSPLSAVSLFVARRGGERRADLRACRAVHALGRWRPARRVPVDPVSHPTGARLRRSGPRGGGPRSLGGAVQLAEPGRLVRCFLRSANESGSSLKHSRPGPGGGLH